jgi:FlaA1/EpsC-like NDP-sugar epimerase
MKTLILNMKWLKQLELYFKNRFLPSGYVYAFDTIVVFVSYLLSYLIRVNFNFSQFDFSIVVFQAIGVTQIYSIFFLAYKSYSGIIRHTSFTDAIKLLQANGSTFLFLMIGSIALRFFNAPITWQLPLGVLIIHFLLTYFLLMAARVIAKDLYFRIIGNRSNSEKRVLIYGAGLAGILAKNAILQDINTTHTIVGFIDDNSEKVGKKLEGVSIFTPHVALDPAFVEKFKVDQLIISIQKLTINAKNAIVEQGLELNLEVKVVPSIDKWFNGKLSSEQIRKVKIEELLERECIKLEGTNISEYLFGKVILVTGAAGSIGSGIVRQVLANRPKQVILLDQAESPLYDLQFEINGSSEFADYKHLVEYVIATVKDKYRMKQIFEKYKPEVVFHAAAYKHVPLMEDNPYAAVLVNVFGTKTVADLAVECKVKKFVMVSTDKAVNPTNIMGATKRIAEIYIQSLSNKTTHFITTRFGNVLDSNGSVVPLFRRQIERGGPITLTHKDITRYFMTIPEACNLVLEAGAMGKGGEIFVFDMGKPVKIYDLAKKMIKLSGFEAGKDIEIKETGLRPGEKLYEELLNNEENTLQTYHPKILRAKIREYDNQFVQDSIDGLASLILEENMFDLVAEMKKIVPEYLSNNSVYSILDKQTERRMHRD